MSNDTVVVPGSTVTPEWLRRRKRILEVVENQLIREIEFPGTGLKLEDLHSFAQQPHPISFRQQLINACYRRLRRRLGFFEALDPLPEAVTEENLAKWAAFNLKPVFLPGEEIAEARNFRNWVKPEKWFYDQMRAYDADKKLGLPLDSARLRRGWYLADFTVGTDYTDGTQVFTDDPLSVLISELRKAEVVGKYENTPMGSRFAITNDEWRNKVLPALTDELHGTGVSFRLERAIEFNAIGNVYDNNRGKFNCWEWFDDVFQVSNRLIGGDRGLGGLASVYYHSASHRNDHIAGRPLGCFV